jgi:GAF domain-containing protein
MEELKITENVEESLGFMVYSCKEQLQDEKDIIANLSNISAIIKFYLDRCNWAGFYLMKDGELVLGPFQGLPACIRIPLGKGVCGNAAAEKKVLRVDNVHEFPGHIACDGASNSEIVIPIIKDGEVYGVLDIDSPEFSRFTEVEEKYLTEIVKYIEASI